MKRGPWHRKSPLDELTRRERRVLSLLMKGGYTNKEMAQQLDVVEVTIKIHLKGMFRKLGVTNRTQVILKVMGLGLKNMGTTVGELVRGLGL